MHLSALEQQRELMRYMNSMNEWTGCDVVDRQREHHAVSARIDQLHQDVSPLGLTGMTRGSSSCRLRHAYVHAEANITLQVNSQLVPPPEPGVEPQ